MYKTGIQIIQVYSNTLESANILANKVKANATNIPEEIEANADLYILSIKDSAILSFLDKFGQSDKFIAHTAGSIPVSLLKKYTSNYGVFYPLQTFSKNQEVDFENIPICIEANNDDNEEKLLTLAKSLSNSVYKVDSAQRSCHLNYSILRPYLYKKERAHRGIP